jgi:hypothetical protein
VAIIREQLELFLNLASMRRRELIKCSAPCTKIRALMSHYRDARVPLDDAQLRQPQASACTRYRIGCVNLICAKCFIFSQATHEETTVVPGSSSRDAPNLFT